MGLRGAPGERDPEPDPEPEDEDGVAGAVSAGVREMCGLGRECARVIMGALSRAAPEERERRWLRE